MWTPWHPSPPMLRPFRNLILERHRQLDQLRNRQYHSSSTMPGSAKNVWWHLLAWPPIKAPRPRIEPNSIVFCVLVGLALGPELDTIPKSIAKRNGEKITSNPYVRKHINRSVFWSNRAGGELSLATSPSQCCGFWRTSQNKY